jgi:hypothetical protein
VIRNASASRLVRLGKGDKAELVFACPPCSLPCDELRYLESGPCPHCQMEMAEAQDGG